MLLALSEAGLHQGIEGLRMGEELIGGAAEDTARHLDSYLLDTLNNVSVVSASPILREAAMTLRSSFLSKKRRCPRMPMWW